MHACLTRARVFALWALGNYFLFTQQLFEKLCYNFIRLRVIKNYHFSSRLRAINKVHCIDVLYYKRSVGESFR